MHFIFSYRSIQTYPQLHFGELENLQVSSKGPGDFVSSADKRTEKILIDEVINNFQNTVDDQNYRNRD